MKAAAICLAGPTASGKSALALQLADALRDHVELEIVSVDSAQVYRGMDIGTAKPDAAERARVRHHLIDILDPEQSYSAALFVRDAQRLVADIRARGHLPLLVGGTMLYFKALRVGLDEMPPADAAVRAALDARAAERGWPVLHAELARIDPATAARLAPNDAQRIQRALEVWTISGRPLSTFHVRPKASTAAAWPMIALEPVSRGWLHERIARRFDAMLAGGLLDEVRALQRRPHLHPQMPSMRCVGYRQAWSTLETGRVDGLREAGVAATRQLAKRQLTWLRSMADRQRIECDAQDPGARLIEQVRRLLD